ncbi:unnamed protein product [Cuscuta campestris]|uniref:cytokinin riboside 5'-monophosphate phosphoribohydrolase n=1 Tax=Cuscuta campestris TaxID=132261 RepID=A0A484LLD3_9ASTE|nr:unnamed protein product [Cuscuta campestris]
MVNNMDHGLPKFSLLGYDDWKIMMEAHLYALHDCMWMVLEDGPLKIQMENPERNPAAPDVVQYIPKPKEKWDDRDCKKHNLDNVAKAAIFKTLDPITLSKIKHLKTAMEIWQGLGKLCEGSEDLRKQKIEVLLEKFKSFKMLPGESFDMLDERFHKILNDLASLNHILSPKEKNVRTYEHELKKKKEEQVTPFPTALMTTPRIPSSEGTCTRNCDTPSSSQPSSSKMENYDEEFAMMVKQFRKFKKFFKKADSVRRPSKGKPQVSDSPPESYLCYNCRKPGHWKPACPYPKVEKYGERERNEKKKKAMVAAESDESSSSSSDEEALVCMERRVEKSNHEDRWTMSEDDTLCLMAKDDADQEITQLKTENESLSEKVKSLNKELGILKSKEAVNKLLETTKHKGRKGLGFDPSSSKRKGKTTFIPPKPTAKPNKQKGKEKEKPTEVPKKFCDKGYSLEFCKDMASLKNISTNEVILTGKRIRNIYEVIWNDVKEACLISKGDTNLLWLWHKRNPCKFHSFFSKLFPPLMEFWEENSRFEEKTSRKGKLEVDSDVRLLNVREVLRSLCSPTNSKVISYGVHTEDVDAGELVIQKSNSGMLSVGLGGIPKRVPLVWFADPSFIPGYIATRRVYGPTYGVEHTVSSNYYKYFEMNHDVEAFIVLPGRVDTMEGLFTLISWASEGLHNRPIGILNIDGYFNNLLKFLDDAVRQNFMAFSQRKLFISSLSVDELLDKLEFAKAFPGPGVSYDEFVNPRRLDLELHL